jgi:hypothetical protein
MKEVITSILVLSLLSCIARFILPRINSFVQWLIKILVKNAEKKIQGSKLGKVKKEKVLKWLKWFGIHSSKAVDEFIETAVEIMNNKGSDIKSETQSEVINNVTDKVEVTSEKVVDKIL